MSVTLWRGSNSGIATRSGETKILFHMDDDETPQMLRLNIPIEQVTLGDFKQKAKLPPNAPHLTFFFRATDPVMGDYKEEIQDNDAHLPIYRNTIVALVVSKDVSVRSDSDSNRSSRPLISERRSLDNGALRDPRNFSSSTSHSASPRRSYGVSPRPGTSTRPNGFLERTNRGYETESTMTSISDDRASYSDSEFDGSSRVSDFTDLTSVSRMGRFMKKKRKKFRTPANLVRASSASSIADTMYNAPDNIMFLRLDLQPGGLGIKVDGCPAGLCVTFIVAGCLVDEDKRIQVGDILLTVNGVRLSEIEGEDPKKEVLKEAIKKGGIISLKVLKVQQASPRSPSRYDMDFVDPMWDQLNPRYAEEPSRPIDLAAWVTQTEAMCSASLAPTSLPPLGVSLDSHKPNMNVVTSNGSGYGYEPLKIVRRAMQHGSGLEISDKHWLKIEIKNAFMGKNLVKWLRENVQGLGDRSDAKNFARELLARKYIEPGMTGTRDFSGKAYYRFTQLPLMEEEMGSMSMSGDYGDDDLFESVSQVAANRLPAMYSEAPSMMGSHYGGFPPSGMGRRVVGKSSSSSGSERRQQSIIYEEASSQATEMYNGGGGGGGGGHSRGNNQRYF